MLRSRIVQTLLLLYKGFFSPLMHALVGPGSGCKYNVSCSEYAARAVTAHGWIKGTWMGLKRLATCHPFSSHRLTSRYQ
ncbi:membrane protein insertion efficiency factor YidD [bacterium]|nr:membrane protein insertion efficiency factor YidD [bacterium]